VRDNARVQRRDFLTALGRALAASAAAPLLDACSGGGKKSAPSTAPTTRAPSTTRVPSTTSATHRGQHTPHVDVTGATDVTAGLQAFIDAVPNGATITFPAHARYRLDGTLNVFDRHGLTFLGQDTSFHHTRRGVRGTSHWSVLRGKDLVWRDLTLLGQNTDGGYTGSLEAQHGWNIAATDGFEIDGCTVKDIYGDFVYMTNYPSKLLAKHGHIHDCTFTTNGRQGISFIGCTDIEIDHNTIQNVARTMFDFEPNNPTQQVHRVSIHDNDLRYHRLNFLGAGNGTPNTPMSDITVHKNTGFSFGQIIVSGSPTARRSNFTFTDNVADGIPFGIPMGYCMVFRYVDGVTVTGNTQKLQPGRTPKMRLALCADCTNIEVSGNHVPGGDGELQRS
jgi:hypothetical protein